MSCGRDIDTLSSPRLNQGLAYWRSKRRGRTMPSWHDLDPVEIPRLMPHLMLIAVLENPLDFRYRLIGTAVRAILHQNYTGLCFSEIPGRGRNSVVWSNCEQVVVTRRPFSRAPSYAGPAKDVQTHENLLLPLSEDATKVDAILYMIHCIQDSSLVLPFSD